MWCASRLRILGGLALDGCSAGVGRGDSPSRKPKTHPPPLQLPAAATVASLAAAAPTASLRARAPSANICEHEIRGTSRPQQRRFVFPQQAIKLRARARSLSASVVTSALCCLFAFGFQVAGFVAFAELPSSFFGSHAASAPALSVPEAGLSGPLLPSLLEGTKWAFGLCPQGKLRLVLRRTRQRGGARNCGPMTTAPGGNEWPLIKGKIFSRARPAPNSCEL